MLAPGSRWPAARRCRNQPPAAQPGGGGKQKQGGVEGNRGRRATPLPIQTISHSKQATAPMQNNSLCIRFLHQTKRKKNVRSGKKNRKRNKTQNIGVSGTSFNYRRCSGLLLYNYLRKRRGMCIGPRAFPTLIFTSSPAAGDAWAGAHAPGAQLEAAEASGGGPQVPGPTTTGPGEGHQRSSLCRLPTKHHRRTEKTEGDDGNA